MPGDQLNIVEKKLATINRLIEFIFLIEPNVLVSVNKIKSHPGTSNNC